MPTISEIRDQYPQYQDMSDAALADALHAKFYSDMPRDDFNKKIGAGAPTGPDGGSTILDTAKSLGVGLGEGAIGLLGSVGDAGELVGAGVKWAGRKLGLPDPPPDAPRPPSLTPTSAQIKNATESVTGQFYEPQTTAGKYARSVGQYLPAVALPVGGGVGMRTASAVMGGLGSEAAGQAMEGTAAEPYARVVGGILGGMTPGLARRAITPLPTSPERNRLVQVLRDEGVDAVTAGQRTGNNALRYMESALGDAPLAGGRGQGAMRQAQEQFTSAALRRAGTEGLATPETLQANQTRLGQIFDDISSRNVMTPDQQFVGDVMRTARQYVSQVLPSQRAQGRQNIEGIVNDIVAEMNRNNGVLPGPLYQATRSRLSSMADGIRQSDPQLNAALRGVRDALDNAFSRSVSPQDAALLAQTRRQYGAQKVLEEAVSRAGEATGEGIVVPSNLRNTVAAKNRGAYARGQGDFAELSRAGATVMTPMPQSGTGPRLLAQGIPAVLGSLFGGGAGAAAGGVGAAGGAALGATIGPGIAGRALMSRPVQAYLGNQLFAGAGGSREAVARALLQGSLPERLRYQPQEINGLRHNGRR